MSFNVSALAYRDDVLLTPTVPLRTMGSISEDVDTRVFVLAGGSYLLSVVSDQHENYKVSVDVPTVGDTGINENLLRAAGTDYPTEVKALYLSYPKEAIGANARAVLKEIEPSVEQDTPYDWALATQEYLRSDAFHYDTDVRRFNCSGNVVECFARDRYGFCQYFATEMAILLRSKGIPTRMVQGFLPGERDASGANELLTYASSHAWVQVYFPGVGWVNFDPTKGQGVVIPLPAGPAVLPRPSASPLAVPSGSLDREQDPNLRSPRGGAAGPADAGGPSSPGSLPFVIVGLMLAGAIGGLAFLAYRRGPRGPAQPDSVYEGVVRLAARLGFAPRATQTVYEYAGALGEELPGARPSLQVVAQAKVEVAYGHRVLGQDRISALRGSAANHDRHIGDRLQSRAQHQTIHVRQHQIEDDQIRSSLFQERPGIGARLRYPDTVPAAFEGIYQRLGDRVIILDEHNCGCALALRLNDHGYLVPEMDLRRVLPIRKGSCDGPRA